MFARNKKHRIKKRKKETSTRISPDPPKNLQGFNFLCIKPEHYIREKKRRLKKKEKRNGVRYVVLQYFSTRIFRGYRDLKLVFVLNCHKP